jgi:hypothetical protein
MKLQALYIYLHELEVSGQVCGLAALPLDKELFVGT